jgi:hypothetical protein
MHASARLDDLLLALEFDSDEQTCRYDRETGQIVSVDSSTYYAVEEGDEEALASLSGRFQTEIDLARTIVADAIADGGRFIELPDKFEFHEYRHMERFIGTIETAEIAERLWRAIKGKGAFRHFKDTLHRLGLEKRWYAYREEVMKRFVLTWAAENGVPVEDEPRRPPR